MSETVGQHSVATFTSPVNGTSPIDANTVKGNDNTLRSAYVDHDADPGIHVQSSTLASRPVANSAGRKWMTQDSGVIRLFYDDGTNWYEVDYLRTTGGTISGNLSISGTLAVTGVATLTAQPILSSLTASQAVFTDASKGLVSNAITGTGNVVMSASPTLTGTIGAASMTLSGTLGVTGLLTFASLKGTGATTVTNILDEDNMASDSATALATQQSIKAYVDAQVGASDALSEVLAIGNTTGANDIIVSTGQKIRTPAVAAGDGTSAITIANTTGALTLASALADSNLATISTAGKVSNSATTATSANTASAIVARDSSGNFTAGTITATLSGAAPAGSLSGTTLASNVVSSSLTSVGTLTSGAIGSGFTAIPNSALANSSVTVNGTAIALGASGTVTAAAGTLTGTTLASNVVSSSLTSVGTLSSLSVSGNTGVGGVLSLTGAGGSGLPAANGVARFASSSTDGAWIIGQGSSTDLNILNKNGDGVISIPTGTKGVVMSGDLTVDTSTLKVDSTNNRVGIGTASPGAGYRLHIVDSGNTVGTNTPLFVSSANGVATTSYGWDNLTSSYDYTVKVNGSTTALTISNTGNLAVDGTTFNVDATNNRVGIGTASPATALHTVGEATIGGGSSADLLTLRGRTSDGYGLLRFQNSDGTDTRGYIGSPADNVLAFFDGGFTERMRLDASGNLGLGVTPSAWSGLTAFQIGGQASLSADGTSVQIGTNAYFSSGWKYIGTGNATNYYQLNGQHVWRTAPSGTAGNAITFTQAMTLDASGNLGVGATSPITDSITLYKATYPYIYVQNSSSGTAASDGFRWGLESNTEARIDVLENLPLTFRTNATERARITSGGYFKASNAGTYVNSTGTYHELRNTANETAALLSCSNTGFTSSVISSTAYPVAGTGFKHLVCRSDDGNTEVMNIRGDGNLYNTNGTYGTISDERLKQDIVDAGSAWDDLKAVRFRKYRMKSDVKSNPDAPALLGVVAQELEQVMPGLVDDTPDYEDREVMDEDGNVTTERVQVGTTKTVKSSILLMKAAVALQEAMARIESLEARLAALES